MNSIEDIHSALAQYRIGNMYSPKIEQNEALAVCVKEFISAIKEDRQPITGDEEGLEVVRILEAIDKSIKNKGAYVELIKVIKSEENSNRIREFQKLEMKKNKDNDISYSEFEKAVGF